MPRLRLSTEHDLEGRLAAVLKNMGHPSHHNSDAVLKGIPDRYVYGAGGLWVEVKFEDTFHKLMKGFDRQRTFMDMLHKWGEKAWVCALIPPKNQYAGTLFIEPWATFKWRDGSYDRINGFPTPCYMHSYEQLDAGIKYGMGLAING